MTDVRESLDQALDDLDTPPVEADEETTRYRVTDDGGADWVMRKIARLDERIAEIHTLAGRQLLAITQWREKALAEVTADRVFFAGALAEYHRGLLAEDPKRKTVKLPHGTLAARKSPDRLEVLDQELFIDWAEGAGAHELLTYKTDLDRRAIKDALVAASALAAALTGRPAAPEGPGVYVASGDVRFEAKPAGPAEVEE